MGFGMGMCCCGTCCACTGTPSASITLTISNWTIDSAGLAPPCDCTDPSGDYVLDNFFCGTGTSGTYGGLDDDWCVQVWFNGFVIPNCPSAFGGFNDDFFAYIAYNPITGERGFGVWFNSAGFFNFNNPATTEVSAAQYQCSSGTFSGSVAFTDSLGGCVATMGGFDWEFTL